MSLMPKIDKRRREREQEVREAVLNAHHFLISLFLGPGLGFEIYPTDSLARARNAALVLVDLRQSSRRCVVYAVDKDGKQTPIPDSFTL